MMNQLKGIRHTDDTECIQEKIIFTMLTLNCTTQTVNLCNGSFSIFTKVLNVKTVVHFNMQISNYGSLNSFVCLALLLFAAT